MKKGCFPGKSGKTGYVNRKRAVVSSTCVIELAGGVGKSHGGLGQACLVEQGKQEGKATVDAWPTADTGGKVVARDVGLNPVTRLSKWCPPSLEELGAEERVQPQARESRQQEKGCSVAAPQNEKSARREVDSGLSVEEGVPCGSQAQGVRQCASSTWYLQARLYQ